METLAEIWRSLPFGDSARHAEALTLGATRLLRAGRPGDAFELIDRRCRLAERPRAADLAIRALAARLCGLPDEAAADLARAEAADPLDGFVALTALRLGAGDPAARRIVEAPGASTEALRAALSHLVGKGEAVAALDCLDGRLTGFAAWPAAATVDLDCLGPGGLTTTRLVGDPRLPFLSEGVAACHVDLRPGFDPERFRLREGEALLLEDRLWPRRARALGGSRAGPPATPPARAGLGIVVPVHGDAEATRACLDALLAETAGVPNAAVVLVDDASPDPDVARLADEFAAAGRVRLVRNPANLGYAGAVRRGLEALGPARDVLLLNADAILPEGALARLAEAAYSAPDIGSVTPFSNNGEYASFPRHAEAAPAPTPAEARRIDAAAARLHAGRVVDLPNGTGFCLFVRHDALAAAGGMPEAYRRGYFEDVEFCLRLRRAGFRNVCAPGLYVVHHGTRSFGAAKRALAVRNLALLRQRFPGFEAECAAYAAADPLGPARAALAAALGLPPSAATPPHLPSSDRPLPQRPPTLGVIAGPPAPATDRFLRELSALLRERRPEARLCVLGRTMDDLALLGRGNVFVTGPLAEAEIGPAARRHGALALTAPPELARHGTALAANAGLPFLAASPADPIPTDPKAHVRHTLLALVDRFADRLPPAAAPGRPNAPSPAPA
ncbi:hypothetical protein GCM10011390_37930 [Aureimonas endophytica]|uniref:Glycosyltransferase 2-like domain-containing protein n=1 Tax=Aureimonas endophytica TaxID=2027858 RepID=A0A917E921_9HYPH|nr:glycosyltransferase family 2 protein [Aureimonas endophytica]GGE15246.1 hypothetical protein GCM10011390_37930 [Aureimonas endophytica]